MITSRHGSWVVPGVEWPIRDSGGHRGKYATPHPVAVFSCVGWLLAGQTPHHFLRAFAIDADTNQGTIARIDGPVTPIPFDRHDVSSLTVKGQSVHPAPG